MSKIGNKIEIVVDKEKDLRLIKQGKYTYVLTDYIDYHNRDNPVMWRNSRLYIGNKRSTHSTMIQELFYSMNFNTDYNSLYDYERAGCAEQTQGIMFYRDNNFDDDDVVFGHLVGKYILWDFLWEDISNEEIKNRIREVYICTNRYKQFIQIGDSIVYPIDYFIKK